MKSVRNISKYLVPLFALLLWACGGPGTYGPEEAPPTESQPVDERGYDPLELSADTDIIPQLRPQGGVIAGRDQLVSRDTVTSDTTAVDPGAPTVPVDSISNQAYRVQLFTSKLFGEAKHQVTVAEEIFDQPVYMDYEVPYFKVRVGSFATRDAAESYQQKAKAAGYSSAWVVLVTMEIKEAAPLYQEGIVEPVEDSLVTPGNPDVPTPAPSPEN